MIWLWILVCLGALALAAWMIQRADARNRLWEQVAEELEYQYAEHIDGVAGEQGFFFESGYRPYITRRMVGDGIEVGNFHYLVPQKDGAEVEYAYTYARYTLPRGLPHMLLDSARNPIDVAPFKVIAYDLKLEGGFNKVFKVLVPQGYHIDGLQILTPDVMDAMLLQGAGYDIEMVGAEVYFYARKVRDRGELVDFLRRTGMIAEQIRQQAGRYLDKH
jgi:hypothetical protein